MTSMTPSLPNLDLPFLVVEVVVNEVVDRRTERRLGWIEFDGEFGQKFADAGSGEVHELFCGRKRVEEGVSCELGGTREGRRTRGRRGGGRTRLDQSDLYVLSWQLGMRYEPL